MHDLWKGLRRRLARWRQQHAEEQRRRLALDIALRRFAKLHTHWHLTFFDRFFVQSIPAATLARLEPEVLAREWTRQFRYRDERQRWIDVRQLTPVAASFLCLLESARTELRQEWEERELRRGSREQKRATAEECPEAFVR